jgi:hypothetical protein
VDRGSRVFIGTPIQTRKIANGNIAVSFSLESIYRVGKSFSTLVYFSKISPTTHHINVQTLIRIIKCGLIIKLIPQAMP